MAEEQTAVAETEGAPASETDIDALQAEADAKAQPRTVEDFARERGWKPKEEFTGDEADWREPEEFIAFGMDRNRDLVRDVKSLREQTERMSRTTAEIAQAAAERARSEEKAKWEAKHQQAVEDGDIPAAKMAVAKITEFSTPDKPQNGQSGDSPAVAQFRADNSWFDSDGTARAVAVAESMRLASLGKTEAEQLQAAREAVHKRFPEYAPAKGKAAPAVAQPGARVADTKKKGKGFADMPADAQMACRELVKRGLSTTDGYVKHYWNEGEA